MVIKERIAARIRAIRKRRGLSQEAVASLIDRSPDTISNLERAISLPNYETLDALAKGLNVPLAEFFLEDDDENPSRVETMTRLTDAARQLDDQTLKTAAAIVELLGADPASL